MGRVQPPSQPPPAGWRRRVPAPSGGGSGRGPAPCPRSRGAGVPPALPGRLHRAVWAMRMTVSRDHGGTRFPHTPARGRAWPSRRGLGKPGFPIPSPAGRVWAGFARPQGSGETGFPQTPPGGRVWEGFALPGSMFIPSVCGGAADMQGASRIGRQPVAVGGDQFIHQCPDLLEIEFGGSVRVEHGGVVDVFAFPGERRFHRQRLHVDVGLH